nr:LysM peptidoglycan-binding domain-containing protein [Planctomycetales bacterium]NIM10179.1 LysM peptidoglycan-binding domain-containing protein [Planctomycetales bacterium]NIN09605.1 LysM peptidoglycan-binding domain-containing protein [Planctomycetales bacterium]NIN78726.1 LysM peptidoglycan-binding domain-containing protein [Planctomycetales bacterium]NIO35903.1 LysM peptidoglycan-binding domain-containing protein [Planctomycetales bacterium]
MAERKSRIPRETKIGLLIICALLVVFAYGVVRRVRQPAIADADVPVMQDASNPAADPAEPVQVASVEDPHPPAGDRYASQDGHAAEEPHRNSYYQQAKHGATSELPADRYAFMPAHRPDSAEPEPSIAAQVPSDQAELEDALAAEEEQVQAGAGEQPPAKLQLGDLDSAAPEPQQVQASLLHEDETTAAQQPPAFAASQQAAPVFQNDPAPRYADTVAAQQQDATGYESPRGGSAYSPPHDYHPSLQQSVAQNRPAPFAELTQVRQAAGDYRQRSPEGTYRVMPNDNFWTIAEKLYGSGNYFKALKHYNRQRYPVAEQLAVGDEVLAPSKAELLKLYPDLCPKDRKRATTFGVRTRPPTDGQVYIVQEGDTLFDIARYELGDPSRWV